MLVLGGAGLVVFVIGLVFSQVQREKTQPQKVQEEAVTLEKQFLVFKEQAERGDADSQNRLGWIYNRGEGTKQDYGTAIKWYRKSAEQNFASAQFNLAVCYAKGQGVAENYVEAYAWLNMAARTFYEAAGYRDELAKEMSPDQIVAALKRTKELRAQIDAKLKSEGK